jgi:hypothetical protein
MSKHEVCPHKTSQNHFRRNINNKPKLGMVNCWVYHINGNVDRENDDLPMDFGISYFLTKPLQSPDITRLRTPGSDHRRIQEAREERSTGKNHVTPGHINLEGPNCP